MIWSVLRRAALLLALVALAAGGVTVALAHSANSSAPITKAEAGAFVRAVNLRASDLPGAKALRGAIFGPEAVQYKALKCGLQGRAGIVPVGGGQLWLASSRARVGSIVVVAPSDKLAEAEIAGLESHGGRTCLARALGRALTFERHHKPESSHTVKVAVVPIDEHVGGVHLAIHVLAVLPPIEGVKVETRYFNIDAAFFRVGPADIALFALGANRFPAATEIKLLALLHSRAEANEL